MLNSVTKTKENFKTERITRKPSLNEQAMNSALKDTDIVLKIIKKRKNRISNVSGIGLSNYQSNPFKTFIQLAQNNKKTNYSVEIKKNSTTHTSRVNIKKFNLSKIENIKLIQHNSNQKVISSNSNSKTNLKMICSNTSQLSKGNLQNHINNKNFSFNYNRKNIPSSNLIVKKNFMSEAIPKSNPPKNQINLSKKIDTAVNSIENDNENFLAQQSKSKENSFHLINHVDDAKESRLNNTNENSSLDYKSNNLVNLRKKIITHGDIMQGISGITSKKNSIISKKTKDSLERRYFTRFLCH